MLDYTKGHPGWAAPLGGRRLIATHGDTGTIIDGTCYRNINLIDFDGTRYAFSHRAILTVVVTSKCNAACKFCSNEITFTPAGRFLEWGPALQRVKDFALLGGVTKLALTGGEPTLNPPKLYSLARSMNTGFQRVRLHTNGFGLFHKVSTSEGREDLLDALIGAGLTGVSVSVGHYDSAINAEVMVLPPAWRGMNEVGLAAVAERGCDGFTPRLSCVLTKNGVHDLDGIFRYMEWGRSIGFRRFIFRSCSEIADGFKKATTFTSFNDANHCSIDSFANVLSQRSDVELTYRQRKSDSKVDVYRWGDVTFDIDESSEELDPDPKIRRIILMSNGVAHTSWIDPLSVLFAADYEVADRARRTEFPLTIEAR